MKYSIFTLIILIAHVKLSRQGFPIGVPGITGSRNAENKNLIDLRLNVQPVLGVLGFGKDALAQNNDDFIRMGEEIVIREETAICGKRKIHHTGLITGGAPTKPGDWPWHVALYKSKNSEHNYICGGTLLSETRVLTAGHCVVENEAVISPDTLFAVLGKYNMAGGDIGSKELSIFGIVLHPEYSYTMKTNDIAMLKLSTQVVYSSYIQPICLWKNKDLSKSAIADKFGVVVGWGFTQSDKMAPQLLRAEMPIKSDLDCIKSNPQFFAQFLNDKSFCAGFGNGTSACNGDSGGGLYLSEEDTLDGEKIWYLRGIVSLAVVRPDKNLCDPNYYTIFTDTAKFQNFINANL